MYSTCNVLLIGGMRFKKINAATHRMIGIAKLFEFVGENSLLFGVGESEESGIFEGFKYKTVVYPKTTNNWIHFSISARKYIDFLKKNKYIKYVVVSGAVPSIPTIKIARYCQKNNIKFIFDIGEWYSNSYKFVKRLAKKYDMFLKMRYVCKKYNNYIVSSSFLANYCGPKKNILMLPAIVTNTIKSIKKEERNNNSNVIKLSFVGFIEKNNLKENLTPLINAVHIFNETHSIKFVLSVIGADGESSNSVVFYGKQPYEKSIKHLVNSDFSVIPRSKTRKNQSGFPTKLSESFIYNIPVISTDTSDIKHYIVNGKNGYLISDNTEQCYLECFKEIENEIKKDSNFLNKLIANVDVYNRLKLEYFKDSFLMFFKNLNNRNPLN